jgi:hypothetical protein
MTASIIAIASDLEARGRAVRRALVEKYRAALALAVADSPEAFLGEAAGKLGVPQPEIEQDLAAMREFQVAASEASAATAKLPDIRQAFEGNIAEQLRLQKAIAAARAAEALISAELAKVRVAIELHAKLAKNSRLFGPPDLERDYPARPSYAAVSATSGSAAAGEVTNSCEEPSRIERDEARRLDTATVDSDAAPDVPREGM